MKRNYLRVISVFCAVLMMLSCIPLTSFSQISDSFTASAATVKAPEIKNFHARTGTTKAYLYWDNNGLGVIYQITKYNSKTKKHTLVAVVSANEYEISGLKNNTKYTYAVRSIVKSGKKTVYGAYAKVSFKTSSAVQQICGNSISSVTSASAKLRWHPVPQVKGYQIARYDSTAKKWKTVTTVKTNSYTLKNLKAGKVYQYKIRAFRTSGKKNVYGAYSDVFKFATPGTLNKKSITLAVSDTFALKLSSTVLKSAKSTNTKIAKVSNTGVVTAVSKGTATIVLNDKNNVQYKCTVKVENPSVNATAVTLKTGNTYTVKINSNTQKVTYKSSDTKVATVTSSGVIKAVSEGKAVITSTLASGKTFKTAVTVSHEHKIVILAAKEPTCSEKGLTEGKKCSVCGEILVAQTEFTALGHKYAEMSTEPTWTEEGTAYAKCSVCGDETEKTYIPSKLSSAVTSFNLWAEESGTDVIVSAEADGANLRLIGNVDGIWSDEAASSFNGIFSDINEYLSENCSGATIYFEENALYSNGTINNTALKKTLFTLGDGFFFKVANLGEDGIYGNYSLKLDNEDVNLSVVMRGSKENVAKVKEFSATVSEHIYADTSGENLVIGITLPDAMKSYMATKATSAMTAKEILDASTVGAALNLFANTDSENIFGSQQSAVDKLCKTICSLSPAVNKALAKMTASVSLKDGSEACLFSSTSINSETQDYKGLIAAVTAALNSAVKETKISDYAYENGVYTIPVNIEFDASDFGVMSSNIIKETIIVKIHAFDTCTHNYGRIKNICRLCGEDFRTR